ncbi:MAG: universal stress protein [Rhodospirillaceae bacterium]|nr:universal stress protein [Rhodospirillaceae bacterium]|tara:strand:+ start:850 stop:1356 length:507 start_codon:yes stop_codon:yes gene_type:complete
MNKLGVGSISKTGIPAERFFLVVVDDSDELRVALRFAAQRAKKTGGRVALLSVLEPADFQHWIAVEEKMREERREDAEQLLKKLGAEVTGITGDMPTLYVREGTVSDEIIALIMEEPNISILVLGAGVDKKGPGPLVTSLVGKLSGEFPIPITVVPGTLSDQQIDELT